MDTRADTHPGTPAPHDPSRVRRWLAGFGVWTFLGLLSTLQGAVNRRNSGQPVPWGDIFLDRMGDWYTCAVFTPLFFVLIRRYPLQRARWMRDVAVHLAVISVVVVLKYLLYAGYLDLLELRVWSRPAFGTLLARSFISESMAFWAMLAVVYAIETQRRAREREMQALRLQGQLTQARLEALTASLHPHFLFNTLHAVSTLMHRDVAAADEMIARLGDLLRRSLADPARVEVPVAEEMEMVRSYLAIMQVRFGDRLVPEIRVEPEAADALVPRLILQPLVENAIQHGIASRPGGGRVSVHATARDGRLRLAVCDDGPGAELSGGSFAREGTGVSNTRRRLVEMFGADGELRLLPGAGGGLEVRVDVPLRRAAP